MVELLFLYTLSRGMRDVFIHPRGLGLQGVWKMLHFVTIRRIYNTTVSRPCQALISIFIQYIQNISHISLC